ncbi:LOW QUALITY PROTEIN: RxLR effector candidate protein [Phytophthora palmivora]|uniref:RxLR effector candidate protein n=1 Tax=Phytophthora palmivora TaxID=4796 RepID=A0A2P4XW30_9STRA|nr:LOW QUALITY PROTEIN: RxLR effector candidate protein [Phytophthora palmivora]
MEPESVAIAVMLFSTCAAALAAVTIVKRSCRRAPTTVSTFSTTTSYDVIARRSCAFIGRCILHSAYKRKPTANSKCPLVKRFALTINALAFFGLGPCDTTTGSSPCVSSMRNAKVHDDMCKLIVFGNGGWLAMRAGNALDKIQHTSTQWLSAHVDSFKVYLAPARRRGAERVPHYQQFGIDAKGARTIGFKIYYVDLGDIHCLLKIEIERDRTNRILGVSQHNYILDLLQKFEMTECSSESTPQAKSIVLEKEERLPPEQILAQLFDYRGLVGSLMYLVRGTRPDIANAVRELSKFLPSNNKNQLKPSQRVLKYLEGTSAYGLIFDGKEVMYELYTDASFANANGNRKSVTGYLSEGIKKSKWLWVLLEELGFKQTQPIVSFCDNKGAISITKDPANHTATKHIDMKELYAREIHDMGRIVASYCNTNDMIADDVMKALPQAQLEA